MLKIRPLIEQRVGFECGSLKMICFAPTLGFIFDDFVSMPAFAHKTVMSTGQKQVEEEIFHFTYIRKFYKYLNFPSLAKRLLLPLLKWLCYVSKVLTYVNECPAKGSLNG